MDFFNLLRECLWQDTTGAQLCLLWGHLVSFIINAFAFALRWPPSPFQDMKYVTTDPDVVNGSMRLEHPSQPSTLWQPSRDTRILSKEERFYGVFQSTQFSGSSLQGECCCDWYRLIGSWTGSGSRQRGKKVIGWCLWCAVPCRCGARGRMREGRPTWCFSPRSFHSEREH